MRITLLRHAEVEEKYKGKYNGHIDINLSNSGKEQAFTLAQKYKNEGFDAVFCSDLIRSRETLKPFTLQCRPIFTPALREKSWGAHEGKSFDEICAEGIEYKNFTQWIDALDGESVEMFTSRVRDYFYEVIFKQKAQNILVVTHSGVIKTLLSLLQNISLEEAFATELPYASALTIEIPTPQH